MSLALEVVQGRACVRSPPGARPRSRLQLASEPTLFAAGVVNATRGDNPNCRTKSQVGFERCVWRMRPCPPRAHQQTKQKANYSSVTSTSLSPGIIRSSLSNVTCTREGSACWSRGCEARVAKGCGRTFFCRLAARRVPFSASTASIEHCRGKTESAADGWRWATAPRRAVRNAGLRGVAVEGGPTDVCSLVKQHAIGTARLA